MLTKQQFFEMEAKPSSGSSHIERENATTQVDLRRFQQKLDQSCNSPIVELTEKMKSHLLVIEELEAECHVLETAMIVEKHSKSLHRLLMAFDLQSVSSIAEQLEQLSNVKINPVLCNLCHHRHTIIARVVSIVLDELQELLRKALQQISWPIKTASEAGQTDIDHVLDVISAIYLIRSSSTMSLQTDALNSATNSSSEQQQDVVDQSTIAHQDIVTVLMEAVGIRFQFHYGDSSTRPTSRLDKPEWFLGSLLATIQSHVPLFFDISSNHPASVLFIQRLLDLAIDLITVRINRISKDTFTITHTISQVLAAEEQLVDLLTCAQITDADSQYMSKRLLLNKDQSNCSDFCMKWIEAEAAVSLATYQTLLSDTVGANSEESTENLHISSNQLAQLLLDFTSIMQPLVCSVLFEQLPSKIISVQYLHRVIIPPFQEVFQTSSFAIPPFHSSTEDVQVLIAQANAVFEFCNTLLSWGEQFPALELAASDEFKTHFKYDASERSATIFSKAYATFSTDLLSRRIIQEHLHPWLLTCIKDPMQSFARSMHYGVTRTSPIDLAMHDNLRKALVNASKCTALLDQLVNDLREPMLHSIATDLAEFYFEKVIMQNYYTAPDGLCRAVKDVQAVVHAFTEHFHCSESTWQRSIEASRLLAADRQLQLDLTHAIHQEDYELVSSTLQEINVTVLTLSQCDKILSLIRP